MSKFVCVNCWIPSVTGAQWHNGEGPFCQECHKLKVKPVGAIPIFPPPVPVVEVKKKGKK